MKIMVKGGDWFEKVRGGKRHCNMMEDGSLLIQFLKLGVKVLLCGLQCLWKPTKRVIADTFSRILYLSSSPLTNHCPPLSSFSYTVASRYPAEKSFSINNNVGGKANGSRGEEEILLSSSWPQGVQQSSKLQGLWANAIHKKPDVDLFKRVWQVYFINKNKCWEEHQNNGKNLVWINKIEWGNKISKIQGITVKMLVLVLQQRQHYKLCHKIHTFL